MREGTYFIPKLMFGQPVDVVYAFWKGIIPKPLFQSIFKLSLRLAIGKWEDYGLQTPTTPPLAKHPTLNSTVLEALRHGRLTARRGLDRYDGSEVHFTDGTHEPFDAIVMATGFRTTFPFLSEPIAGWDLTKTPPLYLKMMHQIDRQSVLHRPVPADRLHLAACGLSGADRGAADQGAAAAACGYRKPHPARGDDAALAFRSLAAPRHRSGLSRFPARADARARAACCMRPGALR